VRTVTEPGGGVQRANFDRGHSGLSRDLRRAYRMRLRSSRLPGGRPLPGPAELKLRQEDSYLRSICFFRNPQRRSGGLTVSSRTFSLR
jgi:hypothetical protein